MAGSAGRGRRGRRLGHDARAPHRPDRAGHAAVPLPGDRGTDRRDRPQRAPPARASTCRRRSSRPPTRRRSRDATDLVDLRRAVGAPARDGRARRRRTSPPTADLLSVVKGLERGTLLRMSEVIAEAAGVPTGRVAALSGPNLAAEIARNLPASAVVAAADLDARRARSSARLGRRRFRLYVNQDILGVELCGALKNIVAIAAGRGRRARLRRQRQGRPADPRPGRDDPARDRRRREPADLRRPGRDRRRHRDVRLARCRATTASARSWPRAGRGPRSRRRCRAWPRAPTRSTPRSRWPSASASRCRSPGRSHRALFEGKSVQRCLVDLLARESKDELADYDRWMARLVRSGGQDAPARIRAAAATDRGAPRRAGCRRSRAIR